MFEDYLYLVLVLSSNHFWNPSSKFHCYIGYR